MITVPIHLLEQQQEEETKGVNDLRSDLFISIDVLFAWPSLGLTTA